MHVWLLVAPVAVEAVPAAQGWQSTAPSTELNVPAGHSSQAAPPDVAGLNAVPAPRAWRPAGHGLQSITLVAPDESPYVPAGHSAQRVAPATASLYVPGSQRGHVGAPANGAALPGGHGTQSASELPPVASSCVPGGQASQAVAPGAGANVPRSQAEQLPLPGVLLKLPAAQGEQAAEARAEAKEPLREGAGGDVTRVSTCTQHTAHRVASRLGHFRHCSWLVAPRRGWKVPGGQRKQLLEPVPCA